MKLIRYVDDRGWERQSYIKDDMPANKAAAGIPHNPPDLERLNWDDIVKEINNLLVRRGLVTLKDVAEAQGALENSILSVIKPKLIELYKEQSGYEKQNGHKKVFN